MFGQAEFWLGSKNWWVGKKLDNQFELNTAEVLSLNDSNEKCSPIIAKNQNGNISSSW